jgi:hypothetical protein
MAADLKFIFKKRENGKFYLKKPFSQCCRLQARLKKSKCKNFPIFKIDNFSKTQNFQNSLKIGVFILETYVQRKRLLQSTNYIKDHQKNLAEIGESIVPNREMTGCFRKYLPQDQLKLCLELPPGQDLSNDTNYEKIGC